MHYQHLATAWHPSGSHLLVAGQQMLQVAARGEWTKFKSSAIFGHKKESSLVEFVNRDIFVTAGLEKVIKVWSWTDKHLLHYISTTAEVSHIKFDHSTQCLAFMDFECNIGVWQNDFDGKIAEEQEMADIVMEEAPKEEKRMEVEEPEPIATSVQSEPHGKLDRKQLVAKDMAEMPPPAASQEVEVDSLPIISSAPKEVEIVPAPIATTEAPGVQPIRMPKHQVDGIIDVMPQETFNPNCNPTEWVGSKNAILAWNQTATVALRKETNYTSIDIEFMDRNFHRNLYLNDDYGVSMAAISHSGVILASKAEQQEEDQYEDDDLEEDMDDTPAEAEMKALKRKRKFSHIYFKPFSEVKEMKHWSMRLGHNENAECVAFGTGWVAVATDFNHLRVFSFDGIQKAILGQGQPVVTMVGYENLLTIFYHAGPPIHSC